MYSRAGEWWRKQARQSKLFSTVTQMSEPHCKTKKGAPMRISTEPTTDDETRATEKTNERETSQFLIEKYRYSKGRSVPSERVTAATQETLLNHSHGPLFIKSTFLIDNCDGLRDNPVDRRIGRVYDDICRKYAAVSWKCNVDALRAAMVPEAMFEKCTQRLSTEETQTKIDNATADHDNAQQTESAEWASSDAQKDLLSRVAKQRKRRRVLVAYSGGITSMALLWWCLQNDYDVYLCYAIGALDKTDNAPQANAREIQCLLRLLQYARRLDGKLLFDHPDAQQGGVQHLSRAEIMQRIQIVQIPQATYTLPDNLVGSAYSSVEEQLGKPSDAEQHALAEPFLTDVDGDTLKAHPQAYMLFYRHLLTVAQSLQCNSIALGVHGDARRLLLAAQPFFSERVVQHNLFVPFESRTETLVCWKEASERSWSVWKSYFEECKRRDVIAKQVKQLERKRKKKSSDRNNAAAEEEEPPNTAMPEPLGVWQTAGPALMPNAAHYVSTCTHHDQSDAINCTAELLAEAHTCAAERCTKLSVDECGNDADAVEKAERKDPTQRAEYVDFLLEEKARLLCKRPKDVQNVNNMFNFCGRCIDCRQWKSTVDRFRAANQKDRLTAFSATWQNLAAEYTARLHCGKRNADAMSTGRVTLLADENADETSSDSVTTGTNSKRARTNSHKSASVDSQTQSEVASTKAASIDNSDTANVHNRHDVAAVFGSSKCDGRDDEDDEDDDEDDHADDDSADNADESIEEDAEDGLDEDGDEDDEDVDDDDEQNDVDENGDIDDDQCEDEDDLDENDADESEDYENDQDY